MSPVLIFAAVPAFIYLALAALPPGRRALYGLGLVAVVSVLGGAASLVLDETGAGLALALLCAAATALAGLAQALRHVVGQGRPAWLYPMVVIGLLAGAAWPMVRNLGS